VLEADGRWDQTDHRRKPGHGDRHEARTRGVVRENSVGVEIARASRAGYHAPISLLLGLVRSLFVSRGALVVENLELRRIRDIAAFDRKPRFPLHDNDGIFGQFGRRLRDGFRCHLDRWLELTMDIEGLPTPYCAPNANPHVARCGRMLSTISSS
jgi:hypothetical protein